MPIYEYRCGACGHKLESLQRLSDAPMVTCPACGQDALTKLMSAAGFQLKGSGWYATDFKNSGAKPAAKDAPKTDAKADTAAGASGEAKSDSSPKPDTSAAAPSTKSGESAKSETSSSSDKPAATGTTTGS
ncbi:MAG TPA: FmdB family zinc ribbon protein [Casimicrobiaceae bacterium]|jgi:putative FmdB family regulatory protein